MEKIIKCPNCNAVIMVDAEKGYDVDCDCGCTIKYHVTYPQNKFDLLPSLFALVCEKANNPESARDVYDVLLQEIEIQTSQAYDHPDEDGRFSTIMQCALTLEELRHRVAVDEGLICKECFEPLLDLSNASVCENQKCPLYMAEVKKAVE